MTTVGDLAGGGCNCTVSAQRASNLSLAIPVVAGLLALTRRRRRQDNDR